MTKKKKLFFSFILILLANCSFDKKTGIWSGGEGEIERIAQLEREQKHNVTKLYSSKNTFSKEKILNEKISLTNPIENTSWQMSNLNNQNFLGNIYLSGVDNVSLKKKIGKNKYSLSKNFTSPIIFKNNIIFSDDRGTIFNINQNGKLNWKKNIYEKVYKRIYKNLTFSIYQNKIYIADNVGFIYVILLESGKLVWIKNHGVPLKSNIKIFNDKMFLLNQDNRLLCLNTKDGSKIWDHLSISSFIKLQKLMSLALTKEGNVIFLASSGELTRANGKTGRIDWAYSTSGSLAYTADFFKSSGIVITDKDVIFSAGDSTFSYNLNSGFNNWEINVTSAGTPIVDKKNIFIVTENGYFVILSRDSGKIISSTYILKILKKRKQLTKISGFIMGSGKIYSVTENGYLIVSSVLSGKVEFFKKIKDKVISSPIINNGTLYILTDNSRIIGFN